MIALVIACAGLCATAATSNASDQGAGRGVLPATAEPHRYSLADMAQATAPFVTSGSNPSFYPQTPFQVLFTSAQMATPDGAGLSLTGGNTFTVAPATRFYVPIIQADDSPPVVGTFPTTAAEAQLCFFGRSGLGVASSQIIIDGDPAPIGGAYLVGPLVTPPLEDGGGTHELQLGAFVGRLERGTHTVEVRAAVTGDAFQQATGLAFVHEDFTYVVNVER